jgi:hypothetical protein
MCTRLSTSGQSLTEKWEWSDEQGWYIWSDYTIDSDLGQIHQTDLNISQGDENLSELQ